MFRFNYISVWFYHLSENINSMCVRDNVNVVISGIKTIKSYKALSADLFT